MFNPVICLPVGCRWLNNGRGSGNHRFLNNWPLFGRLLWVPTRAFTLPKRSFFNVARVSDQLGTLQHDMAQALGHAFQVWSLSLGCFGNFVGLNA